MICNFFSLATLFAHDLLRLEGIQEPVLLSLGIIMLVCFFRATNVKIIRKNLFYNGKWTPVYCRTRQAVWSDSSYQRFSDGFVAMSIFFFLNGIFNRTHESIFCSFPGFIPETGGMVLYPSKIRIQ